MSATSKIHYCIGSLNVGVAPRVQHFSAFHLLLVTMIFFLLITRALSLFSTALLSLVAVSGNSAAVLLRDLDSNAAFHTRSLHLPLPLFSKDRAIPGHAVFEHPAATDLFGLFASWGYRLPAFAIDWVTLVMSRI